MDRTEAHISSDCRTKAKRLHRPLGPLETMYHLYHKRGIDIIAQLICLETHSYVTANEINQALVNLMNDHPLLCMSIHEKDNVGEKMFHFYEMEPHRINLSETSERNWETILSEMISQPFDIKNGPLWRITIVRERGDTSNNEVSKSKLNTINGSSHSLLTNRLVFVFGCHHSIADGIYLRQIYSDFICILDHIQSGKSVSLHQKKTSLFLPPIENILPVLFPEPTDRVIPKSQISHSKSCKLLHQSRQSISTSSLSERHHYSSKNLKSSSVEALDAYQAVYKTEILGLSQYKPDTKTFRFRLSDTQSKAFLLKCKANSCTVTAAGITAACTALISLLKKSLPANIQSLVVPVEIMVNLRRYVTDKTLLESYPGVAAIHIPLYVNIPLKTKQNDNTFWDIASICTRDIYEIVTSSKPIETMIQESENELSRKPVFGKSPFVICLTNLSSVDDVVKPSLQNRYRLVAFPGLTAISIDDMPIFFVNMFTLNRQLNVGVGYCSGYTSHQTAAKYTWNFRQCLGNGLGQL